jgi:hypothetical protein
MMLKFGRRFLGVEKEDDDTKQAVYHPHTVQQIVSKYRLRRLFDCARLRNIYWAGRTNGVASVQLLQDLADWVEAEFASRNHEVACVVTWCP